MRTTDLIRAILDLIDQIEQRSEADGVSAVTPASDDIPSVAMISNTKLYIIYIYMLKSSFKRNSKC